MEAGVLIRLVWTLPVCRAIDKSCVDSSLSIRVAYIFGNRSRRAIDKVDGVIVGELLWPNTRAALRVCQCIVWENGRVLKIRLLGL